MHQPQPDNHEFSMAPIPLSQDEREARARHMVGAAFAYEHEAADIVPSEEIAGLSEVPVPITAEGEVIDIAKRHRILDAQAAVEAVYITMPYTETPSLDDLIQAA